MSQEKTRVYPSIVIGVTGGMGCGKSTVSKLLEDLGFIRIDSDALIRDRVLKSNKVIASIGVKFGDQVLTPAGQIDRRQLSELVFTNDRDRLWLEELIHPLLFDEWRTALSSKSSAQWVIEVPLLFEKQLENWFDFIVCVASSSKQQLARLEQRGIPRPLAEQRISKQLPLAKKIELSDIVLWNDGPISFLKNQVDLLHTDLKSRL
jgi:dephospho-CoA kinase